MIGRSAHPYTKALLNCVPRRRGDGERQREIGGTVPSPLEWQEGCRFMARCELADDACAKGPIALEELDADWVARCVRPLA